jgi:alkylhydroperoxidase family enzyme
VTNAQQDAGKKESSQALHPRHEELHTSDGQQGVQKACLAVSEQVAPAGIQYHTAAYILESLGAGSLFRSCIELGELVCKAANCCQSEISAHFRSSSRYRCRSMRRRIVDG